MKYLNMDMLSVLESIEFKPRSRESILSLIPFLHDKFAFIRTSKYEVAELRWMMKELRKIAIGNLPLKELAKIIQGGGKHDE